MTTNRDPVRKIEMNNRFLSLLVAATAALLVATAQVPAAVQAQLPANAPSRERLLMDFGWKFHLGNEWGLGQSLAKAGTGSGPASTSFSDASWRAVNLPHDWVVELPFDSSADGSHGFHPVGPGFPSNSVAWYRRTFELPKEDAGKRLWLEFDGVFRDATVFVNGWFVGHHESGYSSFRYDITDVANCGGKNVVAVKVDASEFEGWFYEGAGIYRHVWLEKTSPVAIAPDGVLVYTRQLGKPISEAADVRIKTSVVNSEKSLAVATLKTQIIGPNGDSICAWDQKTVLGSKGEYDFWAHAMFLRPEAAFNTNIDLPSESGELLVKPSNPAPELWSPESPKLYKLITTVEVDGKIVDRKETEFGIRTVAFDVEKGFLLNGKPYVLKGSCNHQDHAGVGAALPDALQYFRIAKLKEMGDNAYRTSHNPPTPELLEACDHLGMLVMDENRLLGSDTMHMDQLEHLIRRDRNHPSVGIWSIANEEFSTQSTPAGGRVAATMQDFVKRLDPTRPVTYPAPQGNDWAGINSVIEVRGWNYHVGADMDKYHAAHPAQPSVGTEQASTVSTRGIYANDKERGYVSAYDDNVTSWSNTAEQWWSYFAARPWLSGGFVWTGFDYRGEPTPYGWPCINSHFGILDTCGFPKDNFWYYQSWWTDKPVLHLLPHWNWPGKESQEIDVRALSNCEEVELFLNGQSVGKQTMKKNSELKWKVKYAPGTLSAIGYSGGKLVVETKVETTGAPASIQLTPDRATINADGEDLSIITVAVTDARGRVVPVAGNHVSFELAGPGTILGVGNGDPSCHEPDQFISKWPFRTRPVDGWRWKKIVDPYSTNLAEVRTQFDDAGWASVNVNTDSGPLAEQDKAAFRAHVNVTAEDLAALSVELTFGMIDDDGIVFVNGQKAGESHDWQAAPVFDVKRFLHPGENTIAVALANWSGAGGLNKGVKLQFQEKPELPQWQRSVFNGLAQIIVQSTKEPGEIKLTARADGLSPTGLTLQAQPATPRPAVPTVFP
jgi:beta-galactosidase